MIDNTFDREFSLKIQLKAARRKIAAFRSGDMYKRMEESYQKQLQLRSRLINRLRKELAQAHLETIRVRNLWWDVLVDAQDEWDKKEARLKVEKSSESKRAWRAEHKCDEKDEEIKKWRTKYYDTAQQLEEAEGKIQKLLAQINRDYENSSIPSSKSRKHKKISNNREKTGRSPGAQPGHPGHRRKKQVPTQPPILLPPPAEVADNPDYKKTGRTIVKQLVGIRMMLVVREYHAAVYYNSKTGERTHAAFPEGVVNDVNYDGSIRAFLFLLNNDCCTSIDKSRKFLSDLTGGKLSISKGMINALGRQFADKTRADLRKVFNDMMLSPVMHVDCTNAKVNGRSAYVFICATPDGKGLYFAREAKGHQGVKGTVAEDYQGILVHDHESTFYKYGSDHQECLAHVLRYLKNSMENEPDRLWNKDMWELIREIIHYRNVLPEGREPDVQKVIEYETRYDRILNGAMEEYKDIPPSDYYRDGYNLAKRMKDLKRNHLLFLHDIRVPTTNNEAERHLRSYKRKQTQAMTFRSKESVENLCECMSMLALMRLKDEANLFSRVSGIFG